MNGQTLALALAFAKDPASAAKIAVIAEAGGLSPMEAVGLAMRLEERVEKTASGSVVTVTDAVNAPMIFCEVALNPTHQNEGAPSTSSANPIVGHTGMTVYVSGETTDDPTEYTVSWQTEAGMVYGGTADAVTGGMVVDRKMITLDGNAGWSAVGSKFYISLSESQYTYRPEQAQISNMYAFDKQGYGGSAKVTENKKFYLQSDSGFERIWVYDTDYTLDTFKALLNETPLQITIPVNEYTNQFSGQPVRTNTGTNNIWSDSGNVTVTYWAKNQE